MDDNVQGIQFIPEKRIKAQHPESFSVTKGITATTVYFTLSKVDEKKDQYCEKNIDCRFLGRIIYIF